MRNDQQIIHGANSLHEQTKKKKQKQKHTHTSLNIRMFYHLFLFFTCLKNSLLR